MVLNGAINPINIQLTFDEPIHKLKNKCIFANSFGAEGKMENTKCFSHQTNISNARRERTINYCPNRRHD
jgi:hypothetical protein